MSRSIPTLVLLSPLLAAQQPLPVYVLCGQSNMQGHAKVETFDYLGDDPATAPLLRSMRDADGAPVVCDNVWISYLTASGEGDGHAHGRLTAGFGARREAQRDDGKIGPEFTFGLRMAAAHDGPVLLIKTAWGGKSLHTDFRPPSAGPYPFTEEQLAQLAKQGKDVAAAKAAKAAATGHYYRAMVEHVRAVLADPAAVCPAYDASAGYRLAGFVWFQGWNDMVDRGVYPQRDQAQGYAAYSDCLAAFIRDVRHDLDAPNLPFVIGVMGVGGVIDGEAEGARVVHRNFRTAMAAPAAMAEFDGTVVAVPTAPFWPTELERIADKLGQVQHMARMLRSKNKQHANADGSMSEAEQKAYVEDYRKKLVSDAEQATFARGASNAAYHYMGCAKTMAQIGVAFADALLALRK